MDILISKHSVILTVKDLQVESCEDEEILIEYTLAYSMTVKDIVEYVVSSENIHLTKEYLALCSTKIENWFTKQRESCSYCKFY